MSTEQYIPKSVVVAEIERLRKNHRLDDRHGQGVLDGLHAIERFIDALEMKEVDLDKEIDREIETKWRGEYLFTSKFRESAKHFFELGLKAKNKITISQQRISVLKMEFWTGLQTFENSEMTLSDAYNQGINDILEELDIKAQKGEEV